MDEQAAADIAKLLSNPLRLRFLHTLQGRGLKGTLSAGEFSAESGRTPHNLEWHIDALRDAGVLEVAERVQRRGALEHHYSLTGPRASAAAALMDLLAEGQERPMDYQEAAYTVSALGHPLRIAYLRALGRRGRKAMLSPGEFARESGEEPSSASYHVRVLRDAGVIDLGEKVPQRGSPEYRYRVSGPQAKVTVAMVDLLVRA